MELKNFFAQDTQGNVIPSPTAYVYEAGTTTLATGLKNAAGAALPNPFTGTAQGQLQFSAPGGEYDLRVVGADRDFVMRVVFADLLGLDAALTEAKDRANHTGEQPIASVTGLQTALNARAQYCASRTALASAATGTPAVLTEAGRDGLFIWNAANLSAQVTLDAAQGIYVAPASDTTGASGAWVRQFSGPISPRWFGAAGDGVTNDLVAFQWMAAYINSLANGAPVVIGTRKFLISGGTVTFTKPVTLQGNGEAISQIIFASSAEIVYSGGVPASYTASQFIMDKVGLRVSGVHTSGPLKVTFATGGTGTVPSATFRDSSIQCHADGGSFAYGLWLENCSLVLIDNLRIDGDRDSFPITSAAGLKITGTGADISAKVLACYFLQTGISALGDLEGMKFQHVTMVGVRTGIDWQTSGGGFNPFFTFTDSHINAEARNIYLRGVVEFSIIGNDFYCQNADGNGGATLTMIELDTQYNAGVSMNGRILGNMFQGDNGYIAQASRTGIKVVGRASDTEALLIGANQFQSLGKGIDLAANVNGVRFLDDNTFSNVTTNITNAAAAGNNYIARTVNSGTEWSVADNMGNCRKYGSAVVTLDASGNGTLTYPTGAFSAFRTAVVTNGEPGIQGAAAFSTNYGTSTASDLKFSVRPSPGAATVRINYIAEGAA